MDRWEVVTEMEVTITVITMYQQLRAHVTLLLTGYWKTICQALVTPGGGCHYKPLVSLAEHSSGGSASLVFLVPVLLNYL